MGFRRSAPVLGAIGALLATGCPNTDDLTKGGVNIGGFVHPGSSGSSGTSSSSSSGAAVTGRCNAGSPFGAPTLIEELDSAFKIKPAVCVTRDELEIFYLRDDGGGPDGLPTLRHGRRDSPDGTWTVDTADALDPPPIDLASLVVGGNKLYYYAKLSTGFDRMHASTRGGRDDSFREGTLLTVADGGPFRGYVVDTDDFIYYSGGNDIVRAPVFVSGFSADSEVAVAGYRAIPVLNAPQTGIYFQHDSGTIFGAHRATKTDRFGDVGSELSSPELSDVLWVSPDDCVMYLEGKNSHVYQSRRGQ